MQVQSDPTAVDANRGLDCREDRIFRDLSSEALTRLESINVYHRRAVLFAQDETPQGVFLLRRGRVKLTARSEGGKSVILRIAGPGEVLGLSSVLSGVPFDATAEVAEPSELSFVKSEDLLRFLGEHADACIRVAQELARDCHIANEQIRTMCLSSSMAARFAKFILASAAGANDSERAAGFQLTLTHSEIAKLIGASRETVTRLFSDLERKRLIERRGTLLAIRKRARLEELARS